MPLPSFMTPHPSPHPSSHPPVSCWSQSTFPSLLLHSLLPDAGGFVVAVVVYLALIFNDGVLKAGWLLLFLLHLPSFLLCHFRSVPRPHQHPLTFCCFPAWPSVKFCVHVPRQMSFPSSRTTRSHSVLNQVKKW